MARAPEFVLKDAYEFQLLGERKVLPIGSFVKPMNPAYLPKDTLKDFYYYNKDEHVVCYTRYGFVPIPKKLVVQVTW